MTMEKIHTRIQLILGILLGVSGMVMIILKEVPSDIWTILSVIVLLGAMIWSGIKKVPSGLMFLLSVVAMIFAILYWPVPKGADISKLRIELVEFTNSIWYALSFVLFGYLFWYNRKRW